MKKFSLTELFISIIVAELVGTVSAIISGNFSLIYSSIIQPPFSPPAIVFPVVWTVLYALMGISAYIVQQKQNNALTIYVLQLIVNFLWSIVFFRFKLFGLSAMLAIILFMLVWLMIMRFLKISKISAFLNIPYLLWSAFATYLAVSIYFLN